MSPLVTFKLGTLQRWIRVADAAGVDDAKMGESFWMES
jgi:hypothetical protein